MGQDDVMRWNYSCERKNGDTKEPRIGGVLGCPCEFNSKTSTVVGKAIVIFFSYTALLILTYGDRMEKTWEACHMAEQEGLSYREAKRRSAEEWRPMHEMERAVDVDLFLEAQPPWAKDSPQCLIIFHEMLLHAASEGQKEAKRVVCRGCRWYMPQLNPEAGIPAVQLVHPGIDREELLGLYLEVYKLHRLPSPPPGELAILKEVSSALLCHSLEEKGTIAVQEQSTPEDFHPPWGKSSRQEREG